MVISQLFSYPLKSAASLSLKKTKVTSTGFLNDRRFAVVGEDHQIITAREAPQLLHITATVKSDQLYLSRPATEELVLDLANNAGKTETITLFKNEVNGNNLGDESSEWILRALGFRAHLFALSETIPILASKGGKPGDRKTYTDTAPIHLISKASLTDLNGRLKIPVSIDRFRPNIVVKDCDAYAEDLWKEVKINHCIFEVYRFCKRCVFTTIDPKTGIKDPAGEPIKTLSTYRKGEGGGIKFGVYLIPRKTGTIQLGDRVEVSLG